MINSMNTCICPGPHTDRQKEREEEEVKMCATFKSFPSLEPQRVPLFARCKKSSPGHMVADWHRLAKAERETSVEKKRNS